MVKPTLHSRDQIYHASSRLIAALDHLPEQGCIEWQGWKDRNGYGQTSWRPAEGGQRKTTAHRLAYILITGDIPQGFTIDHLCRNRACVNPAHLEAVPPVVNTARGTGKANLAIRAKLLTGRCPSGHAEWNAMGQCQSCIRERSASNWRLRDRAADQLGITRREYGKRYGYRLDVAARIATDAHV